MEFCDGDLFPHVGMGSNLRGSGSTMAFDEGIKRQNVQKGMEIKKFWAG